MGERALSVPAIRIASTWPRQPQRRLRALLTIAVVALLIHAAVLGRLQWTWPGASPTLRPAGAVQVRAVAAAPVPALAVEAEVEVAEAWPSATPEAQTAAPVAVIDALRPRARKAPTPARNAVSNLAPAQSTNEPPPARPTPFESAAVPGERPSSESPSTLDSPVAAALPTSGGAVSSSTPASTSMEASIPTYRTRFPPPATLRYDLSRGAQAGVAELQWRPGADGYTLRLAADLGTRAFFTQASQGDFDGAGLAPVRYTDLRARRGALATNFQRDAGRISFSGASQQLPLVPGGQDRLSWVIQLAAVLAAEPGRGASGQVVAVPVAGLRGELAVWAFASAGLVEVSTNGGVVQALKMVRASQGPYDGSVEVWFDPARHHLPVRLVLQPGASAPPLELVLRSLDLDP